MQGPESAWISRAKGLEFPRTVEEVVEEAVAVVLASAVMLEVVEGLVEVGGKFAEMELGSAEEMVLALDFLLQELELALASAHSQRGVEDFVWGSVLGLVPVSVAG